LFSEHSFETTISLHNLKTIKFMSNGTNDLSGAISSLIDTMGKLAQQQVEIISTGIKAVAQFTEPLGKTASDLVGNVFSTLNQVLQNISSAIAPKK